MTDVKDLLSSLNPQIGESLDNFVTMETERIGKSCKRTENCDIFLRGKVSFLQFVTVTYTPAIEDLEDAFIRGVAFVCRPGQAGVDIVIPVVLPEVNKAEKRVRIAAPKVATRAIWKNSEDLLKESDGITVPLSPSDIESSEPRKLSIPGLRKRISCLCVQVKNSADNLKKADNYTNPWGAGVFSRSEVRPCMSVKHVLWSNASADITHRWVNSYCSLTVFHGITVPKESSPDPGQQKQFDEDHQKLTDLVSISLDTASNSLFQILKESEKRRATEIFPVVYKLKSPRSVRRRFRTFRIR
jgi:hypothetical protein